MSEDLAPTWVIGSIDLTDYPFSVDRDNAVDIGEPEMVVESLTSQLADGDLERTVRHGNRTYVLPIYVEGPTLADVADAEALLRAELKSDGLELAHNPGDDFSPTSVYEVQTARMTPARQDDHESHLLRKFTLTLTCAPFARSVSETVVSTLSVGGSPSITVFDTCDTATGWTAAIDGAAATASTFWEAGTVGIFADGDLDGDEDQVTLTRTGAVDFTGTPYLVVEARAGSANNHDIVATADGAVLPLLGVRDLGASHFEYVFLAPSSSVDLLTFTHTRIPAEAWIGLFIYDLTRSNLPPGQTAWQPSRIIEVGGTERTPGSLRVSSPDGTSPLGLAFVATWPENGSGFSPPLRRWRAGGNSETVEANTYSGKTGPLGPAYEYFDVPIASLPPGTYQLLALMRASVAGTYAIESVIQSRYDGVTLGETTWGAGGTETHPFGVVDGWGLVPMGVYGVPIVAAKAGEFRILIKTPDTTVVDYDEVWLFPVDDDCALTIIQATEPHLWLDSPDVDSRTESVWEGATADKSDAHWPTNGVYTMGRHVFTPERTSVFTAAGVNWPEVELTYHKRWHSNAAED